MTAIAVLFSGGMRVPEKLWIGKRFKQPEMAVGRFMNAGQ